MHFHLSWLFFGQILQYHAAIESQFLWTTTRNGGEEAGIQFLAQLFGCRMISDSIRMSRTGSEVFIPPDSPQDNLAVATRECEFVRPEAVPLAGGDPKMKEPSMLNHRRPGGGPLRLSAGERLKALPVRGD